MRAIGLLPALALLAGVALGTFSGISSGMPLVALPLLCAAAVVAFCRRASAATTALLVAGFLAAGAARAADARQRALAPTLRLLLDEHVGGFALDTPGPEGDHEPLVVTAVLVEDAMPGDGFVSLRADVTGIDIEGRTHAVSGGVIVSVGGVAAAGQALAWRAGRTIRMPATLRRPARYLNDGVPDFERGLALDGTTLFGSVKSGLLVEVTSRGSAVEETAADVRARVRHAVARRVGRHSPLSAGIVTAVLIGDRTGLPDAVREQLQAAGTYHVIAISGGNIAILAALTMAVLMLAGIRGRWGAACTILALLTYAQVVIAGPSVWRATLVAVVYLSARTLDHRTAPWQATAVAAAVMVVVHPLDVRDPGFVLTFGATAALLEAARRARTVRHRYRVVSWMLTSVAASLGVELALLPVSAQVFSRVTIAGLVLNLLAVPLMTVVQCAGMAVVAFDGVETAASMAAGLAHVAAAALVDSARLVDLAPWLAARVPAPGSGLVIAYYASCAMVLFGRRRAWRVAGAAMVIGAVTAIVAGVRFPAGQGVRRDHAVLRLTVFDVGQGEAMLLEIPEGGPVLIDAAGAPFGGGVFDIGARVLAPALWAHGIRRLDALLVTHGDPDHIGGAASLIDVFTPRELWEGVRVPVHRPTQELAAAAARAGAAGRLRRAGEEQVFGRARIRILHPPEPDWERPRVRNDDSVVMEVLFGDVALLLTGDVGAEIERAFLPRLTHAPVRILKVGHHGSRTSTSPELLDAWRPQVAVISAGRGNTFGHPTPEVLRRLESIGATVLRTDRDGEITIDTDGREVQLTTFTGRR